MIIRALFAITLNLLLCCCLQAQVEAEKIRQRIVTSKIESMTIMGHKYDIEGNEDPRGVKKTHEVYDEKGRLKMAVTYNKVGIIDKTINKYDNQNRKVASIVKDGAGTTIDQYKLSYNRAGKISKKEGTKNGQNYTIRYDYNDQDQLVSKKKTDQSGNTVWTDEYTYDERGNLVKEAHSGTETYETIKRYDANNRLVSSQSFQDTVAGFKYIYTYNGNGQKIKEEQLDGRGNNINTYTYTYNTAGNVSTIHLYSDYLGYLSQKWVYKYDGKGNILEIKIFDTEEGLPVFTSKYIYRFRK